MHDEDKLIVNPACEVNERGTRDKSYGNEVVNDCDLPLDLELTERVEIDDETLPYAEEDWDCPEKTEVDKGVQPDFPFTMETRQGKRGRNKKKYNPYGEDFVIDRIVLINVMDSIVGLDKIVVPQDIDLVDDIEQDWIDDHSKSEVEFKHEMEQMHEQELTNLRVLEWFHDLPADPKMTILPIKTSIRLASNKSVTTTPSPTGSIQMVPYVFQNPISICSILGDRRGHRWIFLSEEYG